MLIGGLESAGHGIGAHFKGFVVDGFSREHCTFSNRLNLFATTGADDSSEGMRFGKFNKTINFRFAAFPSEGFDHRGEAKGRELCLPDGA